MAELCTSQIRPIFLIKTKTLTIALNDRLQIRYGIHLNDWWSPTLEHNPPYPRGKAFWQKSFQTFAALMPQSLYLALALFCLPQLFFSLVLGRIADEKWQLLANEAELLRESADRIDLVILMNSVTPILSTLVGAFIIILCAYIVGYLAICVTASEYFAGRPPIGFRGAIWQGIKLLPAGVIGLVSVTLLALGTQIIFPPLILAVVPFCMTPVLLVNERTNIFALLRRSLTLAYVAPIPGSRIGVFFQLMTIMAVFYLGIILSIYFTEYFLTFDISFGFSHWFWHAAIGNAPYTGAYLLTQVIESITGAMLVVLLISFTTSTYFWLEAFAKRLPKDGVQI